MPQQQNNISFFDGALVIGLTLFLDLVGGIGQWALALMIAILGPGAFFGSGVDQFVVGAASFLLGGLPALALGLLVGAVFSFFISVLLGIGLLWFFVRKGVPLPLIGSTLGPAVGIELVPYFNTVPAWTGATILLVTASKSPLRKIVSSGLSVVTGKTSAAIAGGIERKPAPFVSQKSGGEDSLFAHRESAPRRTNNAPLQIDGIRGTNDNTPIPRSKVA